MSEKRLLCNGLACGHAYGIVVGCHPHCLTLVAFNNPLHLINATKYTYTPTAQEKYRRRAWMLSNLVSRLSKNIPQLPPEIFLEIASNLLSPYAVLMACDIWNMPKLLQISLARGIWCRYVEFEGKRYISSLSNNATQNHSELLFLPGEATVNCLYIQENHLGITKLFFPSDNIVAGIKETPGIWWRIIQLTTRDQVIHAESDVGSLVNPQCLEIYFDC